MEVISNEIKKLAEELEPYSGIYKAFWNQIDTIVETYSIPTAAIEFSNVGDPVCMHINPDYWNTLNTEHKKFILMHECLHVVFIHGIRGMAEYYSTISPTLINIATDITINHYIRDTLKFDVSSFDYSKYIWIENTKFTIGHVEKNRDFQYYLSILQKSGNPSSGSTVDIHKDITGKNTSTSTDYSIGQIVKDAINSAGKESTICLPGQLGESTSRQYGIEPGNQAVDIFVKAVTSKIWNSLMIKNRTRQRRSSREDIDFTTSWIKENRRSSCLEHSLMLPREVDDLVEVSPVRFAMYIDVSGSCSMYVEPFTKLVKSVPAHKFDFSCYGFDTKVYDIDHRAKVVRIPGGGGTNIGAVISHANQLPRFPDVIVVITDGEGSLNPTPKHPERYKWMLTSNHTTHYIKSNSAFKNFKPVILPPFRNY